MRVDIAYRRPSRAHALVWIVYSSELGYRYSGDEYWQTFERETPGWVQNEIATGFGISIFSFIGISGRGARLVCGLSTSRSSAGRSRMQSSPRICNYSWRRTLYELRYSYSGDVLASPESLGDLIAARSWNATSRFQTLAQENSLWVRSRLLFSCKVSSARAISYIL